MYKADEIDNSRDIIDSRDVIEAIAELEEESVADPTGMTEEDLEKLKALRAFEYEATGYAEDWKYGATLIRDSYFQEYAEQMADDIGAINRELVWPLNCIDWEKAARELKMDYTSVEFDGVTYWVR